MVKSSKERLIKTFYTSGSQIHLGEVDLITSM